MSLGSPLARLRGRDAGDVAHLDLTGLEVELGAQEDLERHRLRPEVAADLELDDVVRVEDVRRLQRRDLQRVSQDAWLEAKDRLADRVLEAADVELGGELPGERRQAEVQDALGEQRIGFG